jgi:hypothetical protein
VEPITIGSQSSSTANATMSLPGRLHREIGQGGGVDHGEGVEVGPVDAGEGRGAVE